MIDMKINIKKKLNYFIIVDQGICTLCFICKEWTKETYIADFLCYYTNVNIVARIHLRFCFTTFENENNNIETVSILKTKKFWNKSNLFICKFNDILCRLSSNNQKTIYYQQAINKRNPSTISSRTAQKPIY